MPDQTPTVGSHNNENDFDLNNNDDWVINLILNFIRKFAEKMFMMKIQCIKTVCIQNLIKLFRFKLKFWKNFIQKLDVLHQCLTHDYHVLWLYQNYSNTKNLPLVNHIYYLTQAINLLFIKEILIMTNYQLIFESQMVNSISLIHLFDRLKIFFSFK
jgi:hypothetical protein